MRHSDSVPTSKTLMEIEMNAVHRISRRFVQVATIALVLAACTGQQTNSETSVQADAVSSTTVPIEVDAIDSSEALAVAGEFFEAMSSTDESKAFDLLAENTVLSDSLAGELDPAESGNWLVWRMAQGTMFGNAECAAGEPDGDDVVVSCTTEILDALGAATNARPGAADATVMVSSAGISAVDLSYQPRVGEAPSTFVDWLETQYPGDPDAEAAAAVWGDSVEVSRERGEQRAESPGSGSTLLWPRSNRASSPTRTKT